MEDLVSTNFVHFQPVLLFWCFVNNSFWQHLLFTRVGKYVFIRSAFVERCLVLPVHLASFGLHVAADVIECLTILADAEHLNAVPLCFEMAPLAADHVAHLALLVHDLT